MTKVFCYRNLRYKHVVWSVRSVETGFVIDRTSKVILKDVKLKVSQAGRARVLKEQIKNVHAGVQGKRLKREPKGNWIRVQYNPYKNDSFVNSNPVNNEPLRIFEAKYAKLTSTGLYVII